MRKRSLTGILLITLTVVAGARALAQVPSITLSAPSGAPGANVTMNVTLHSNGGTQPAGVQWDLLYSSTDLSPSGSTFYITGGAASAAGKSASCNVVSAGDVRCVVVGFNSSSIDDGALAGVTFKIAAGTSSTSSPVTLSGVLGTDTNGNSITMNATGANVTINQPSAPVLSNVTCTQSSLTPPGTASCSVSLSGPAAGNTNVGVSSDNAKLIVSSPVTVTNGTNSNVFTANAPSAVSSNTPVTITATLDSVTRTFTVTLTPPAVPVLSNLTCTPGSLTPPGTAFCTVSLSAAAIGDTIVGISSNSAKMTAPSPVTVSNGTTSIGFTANAPSAVASNTPVMLTASLDGNARNFAITLTAAQGAQPGVSSLVCAPNSLTGGASSSCTVFLTAAAPAGGTVVGLSSNNSYTSAPSQVTVPAGLPSAGFTVTTVSAGSTYTSTISATSAGVTQSATLTIQPASGALASLTCSPGTIGANGTSNCTVSLTAAAPVGGSTVALSGSAGVSVPGSVLIPAGSSSAVFAATAGAISADMVAVLTATSWSGSVTTYSLMVTAQAALVSVACSPSTVSAGATSNCLVRLSKGAPGGGMVVTLASANPSVSVPASVTVAANASTAAFNAMVAAGTSNGAATISATAGSVVQTALLTIGAQTTSGTLVCSPPAVQTPGTSSCLLTVGTPAPSSGLTVSLTSSSTSLTVPSSVTIGAGLTSASFTATATLVKASTPVSLTAPSAGASQTLTLLPPANTNLSVSSLACNPQSLTGGGTSACQIALSGAAPAGGLGVQLSSSSAQITVPAVVEVAEGGTAVQFTVTSALIDHNESAVLTANLASSPTQIPLTLVGLKPLTVACSPKFLPSGSPLSCQITLNSAQATGRIGLALTSSNSHVAVPASVSSQPGQATITFQGTSTAVTNNLNVTLTASFHATAVQDAVTLTPGPLTLSVPGTQSARPGKATVFQVSASDPAGLAVTLSVAHLPPNAGFNPNTGTFTWVPQAFQIGLYTVHFTATDSALASDSKDVVVDVGSDTPVILVLANGASFLNDGGCSPGEVASLLGAGFVNTPAKAAEISPIPTQVNNVRVSVNGDYLPVFYASENQVNFQCPTQPTGETLTILVESNTGSSPPHATKMRYATPGIFTVDGSGKGQGAIINANTVNLAMAHVDGTPSQPAKRGKVVSIYATGLGAVAVDVPAGHPAPLHTLDPVKIPLEVMIGGSTVKVEFAGLAPGYAGVYQVNARLPLSAPTGDAIPLQIVVHLPDSSVVNSNVVTMAIGTN